VITVTRHRGGGRDDNGQLVAASTATLNAFAVAPGGGQHQTGRARDGETIACVVYFTSFPDLTNADELTVNGDRYHIIVNEWRSPWGSTIGGLEVLCSRGHG
jgi:hypothetical protein